MNWWQHLTDLGSLNVTAPIAVGIAAWLGVAHCVRLAGYWTAIFLGAMSLVVASKIAFLGWGIGSQALDFAGFSGHAARAAAVFRVAIGLLLHRQKPRLRNQGVLAGVLIAAAIAVSRVVVGAHSVSEAASGCLLGLAAALLFIDRARAAVNFRPGPVLVAITPENRSAHDPAVAGRDRAYPVRQRPRLAAPGLGAGADSLHSSVCPGKSPRGLALYLAVMQATDGMMVAFPISG